MAGLDRTALDHLLTWRQNGVVARRQILELGGSNADIERMVRRRELTSIHPGILVNHTGRPTWGQRAMAAVLVHWPAALSHVSALPVKQTGPTIHVAISNRRTVRTIAGITVHRVAHFDDRTDFMPTPPRIHMAHAAVDALLACERVGDRFVLLGDLVQTRQITVAEIKRALDCRLRVTGRGDLNAMLVDFEVGANSVLEREFLRLERAHHLPAATRQVRSTAGGRTVVRDAVYEEFGVIVELDGRAFHDTAAARNMDAVRDLDAAVAAQLTLRLTYGQVFDHGCVTTAHLARILRSRGWTGIPQGCPRCLGS